MKSKITYKIIFSSLIIACCIFFLWLFWPITLLQKSLICALPEKMVAAIEIRNTSALLGKIKEKNLYDFLHNSSTISLISQFTGQPMEAIKQKINEKFIYIEQALNQPFGLGLVARFLHGPVAIAIYDIQANDISLVAQLDNFSKFCAHFYLWKKNGVLQTNKHYFYGSLDGNILMVATSKPRLQATATSLAIWKKKEIFEPLSPLWHKTDISALTYPSALFLLCPDEKTREIFIQKTGYGFWLFRSFAATLFFSPVGPKWQSAIRLDSRVFAQKESEICKSPAHMPPAAYFSLPGKAAVFCKGWVNAPLLWQCFNQKLWDQRRPLRGCSHPFTVLAWETLDQGVLPYSDGRFLFWLNPRLSLVDDCGVPAMPEISGFLGVHDHARAQKELAEQMAKVVEFYTAPGGNEFYQAVRQETKLEVREGEGEEAQYCLRLHPLFFNHLDLAWKFSKDFCVFTAGNTRLMSEPLPKISAFPSAGTPSEHTLADVSFGWQEPEQVFCALRDVIEDKAVHQGFASPLSQLQIMALAGLIVEAAKHWPFLEGSLRLEKIPGKGVLPEYWLYFEFCLLASPAS
ncbi:MAG: hypothetical protein N3A66_00215 [Planctomycetota bacterium]|nr:hypothetical protein [Planctomycetota bacterium]